MPSLPPLKDVLDLLRLTVLPAVGGAAFAVCLFRLLGRWSGSLGSAVAVAAAFLWANYNFDKPGWDTARLLPWVPETATPEHAVPGWHWLPRVALLFTVVGLLSRWAGMLAKRKLPEGRQGAALLLVWLPRAGVVVATAGWLAAGKAAEELRWLHPALAAAMFAVWLVLDGVAQPEASGEVSLYLAAALLASGTVLLYAHSLRFAEVQFTLGCATFAAGVTSLAGKTSAAGTFPAGAAFLPGLVLAGRPSLAENNVPDAAFWLVALAPLALAPFLIPRLARQHPRYVVPLRAILALAPLVVAVVLAMQHEKLPHEIDSEW